MAGGTPLIPVGAAPSHHLSPFGWVAHEIGQTGKDFVNAAINSPAGLYHLGGGLIHDPGDTLKALGGSVLQDFEHPLRHPGYTLMDVLGGVGLAGGVLSRAGALGRVAAGTSEWTRPLDAAIFGAKVPDRVIRLSGKEQRGWTYSRNPIIRQSQKLLDDLHERFPEGSVIPPWRSQASRINSASKSLTPIVRAQLRSEAVKLLSKFQGLHPALHEAVHLTAIGVLPKDAERYFRDRIHSGDLKGRTLREAEAAIPRIQEAAKYLESYDFQGEHGSYTLPRLKTELPELHEFRGEVEKLSRARESALHEAGYLSEESALRRALGPKNIIEGHGLPENLTALKKQLRNLLENLHLSSTSPKVSELRTKIMEAEGQLSLEGTPENTNLLKKAIQDPALAKPIEQGGAGLFRIPEMIGPGARLVQGFQRAYKGGKTKAPGSVTHQYTGGILAHGGGRWNVAENTAESYIEAQRFLALRHVREEILASAKDTPQGIPEQWRLPIREDWFKGKMPDGFEFADRLAEKPNLSDVELEAGGRWYEPLRQKLFGDRGTPWRQRLAQLTGHTGLDHMEKIPGIKWVDRRTLGGLDKQNPLWSAMESPYVRGALKTADAINTAQKFALLYLKPAYIIPNMLGNIALALVQQGFLAPINLAKSARVLLTGKGLDKETVDVIKNLVSGGSIRSLGSNAGLGDLIKETSNRAADFYGRLVDDPLRFSSFLHEARARGFATPEELRKLTQDPELKTTLDEVAVQANDSLIAYERLSPGEQTILRRLVFFYPWVKGSTRYAFRLGAESPTAAGAAGQGGKEGHDWVERTLGAIPSYTEGIFRVGTDKGSGLPLTVNPASFSILGTSGELANEALNLFHQPPNPDLTAANNLSPVDAALLSILSGGKTQFGGNYHSPVVSAVREFGGGNPIVTLIKALTETTPANRLYPDNNDWHALSRFGLLGGLTPRVYNPQRGHYTAYNEQHPR